MIWESFGGWFSDDPSWLVKLNNEKQSILNSTGLSEEQLDIVVKEFVSKDILRMN